MVAVFVGAPAGCGDPSESADAADVAGASCRGVAVPCAELHSIDGCSLQAACGYDYHNLLCTGVASPCSSSTTAELCLGHAGCDWTAEGDPDAPVCGGAGGCSMIPDQYACTLRIDCIWDRAAARCVDPAEACACRGTTPACATYGEQGACQRRGGCTWDAGSGACTGTAWPCENNPYPDACLVVPGCSWN